MLDMRVEVLDLILLGTYIQGSDVIGAKKEKYARECAQNNCKISMKKFQKCKKKTFMLLIICTKTNLKYGKINL